MIALTDSNDYGALHDEPSRQLRVFPAKGERASSFTLYEDDDISRGYERGDFAEVTFELVSTARTIELRARRSGTFAVRPIRVVLPGGERRRLVLRGTDVALVADR